MNELSILDSLLNGCMDNTMSCNGSYRSTPRVDVIETKSAYNLYMDLPGMNESSVDIQIEKGVLNISSKKEEIKEAKKDDKEEEKAKYLLRERRTMEFERSFSLPDDVDEENITASFKNGVLEIVMQKTETKKPRKIEIKAA